MRSRLSFKDGIRFCFFFAALSNIKVQAQENSRIASVSRRPVPDTSSVGISQKVVQKDIYDIVGFLLRKQATKSVNDTIATTPVFSVVPAIGYSLQSKFAAVLSGNAVFSTDGVTRMSTITASVTYTQNKQFYIPVQTNIVSANNRFKFIGDFRFYKYPQSTFGLGSSSSIHNEDPMNFNYFRFYQTILKKINNNLFAGAGYNLDYHWNISHKGNKNGTESDFSKYDTSKSTTSSGITLNVLYDSRNNYVNARTGFYSNFQIRNNFEAIGSNSNWKSLLIDVRKYFPFPAKSSNILAFWSYNVFVLAGIPPYLDLPSTGWDSYNTTGRGFIQGRFRGTKMVYFETEYRFNLTSNGLLGGVLFVNEESFTSFTGSRFGPIQTGFGTGIRLKLNKYSNTNLAIDYGFGSQGSKGLFITVGEVF